MKPTEYVDTLAERLSIPKTDARRFVDAAVSLIGERVNAGEEVSITGLGKFQKVRREGRQGRNLHTQEVLNIPASNAVKFTATKSLKDALNR